MQILSVDPTSSHWEAFAVRAAYQKAYVPNGLKFSTGEERIRYLQNFAILAILEIRKFLRNVRNFAPAISLPAIPCPCTLGFFFLMSEIPPEEDALNELVAAPDDKAADAPAKKKAQVELRSKDYT